MILLVCWWQYHAVSSALKKDEDLEKWVISGKYLHNYLKIILRDRFFAPYVTAGY